MIIASDNLRVERPRAPPLQVTVKFEPIKTLPQHSMTVYERDGLVRLIEVIQSDILVYPGDPHEVDHRIEEFGGIRPKLPTCCGCLPRRRRRVAHTHEHLTTQVTSADSSMAHRPLVLSSSFIAPMHTDRLRLVLSPITITHKQNSNLHPHPPTDKNKSPKKKRNEKSLKSTCMYLSVCMYARTPKLSI